MRTAIIGLVFALIGCAGSRPAPAPAPAAPATKAPAATVVSSEPAAAPISAEAAPVSSANESAPPAPPAANVAIAPLPPKLGCNATTVISSKPAAVSPSSAPPPSAGQMTEEAAQAKRLFDSEKWREAATALDRVAQGETGDDDGNRQLAEYHEAIALYRLGRLKEAYAKIGALGVKPNHLKHLEAALWLVKIAEQRPALIRLADFAGYSDENLAFFDNPAHREVHSALLYWVGRQRLAAGRVAEARSALEKVPPDHPYASAAKACLELIAHRAK